jgi:gamma-glutamyltranspeptidase
MIGRSCSGRGFIVGVGNGLILGYLMYRSRLVPRGMAMLGLIGGPLIIASGIAVLFDVIEPGSAPQAIATAPEFVWDLSLGIWLMVKGFKPSPILREGSAAAGRYAEP